MRLSLKIVRSQAEPVNEWVVIHLTESQPGRLPLTPNPSPGSTGARGVIVTG